MVADEPHGRAKEQHSPGVWRLAEDTSEHVGPSQYPGTSSDMGTHPRTVILSLAGRHSTVGSPMTSAHGGWYLLITCLDPAKRWTQCAPKQPQAAVRSAHPKLGYELDVITD